MQKSISRPPPPKSRPPPPPTSQSPKPPGAATPSSISPRGTPPPSSKIQAPRSPASTTSSVTNNTNIGNFGSRFAHLFKLSLPPIGEPNKNVLFFNQKVHSAVVDLPSAFMVI